MNRARLREFKSLAPAMRKAIIARDGNKCRMPGCGCRVGLEVHHIDGDCLEASREAYCAPGNLITLCRHCHNAMTMLEIHYPAIYIKCMRPVLLQPLILAESAETDGKDSLKHKCGCTKC